MSTLTEPNQVTVEKLLLAMKAINDEKNKVHIAGVERHGEKIILPTDMKIEDAITSLQRQQQHENEKVAISYDFPYFVWDGAYALGKVMEERYGFVFGKTEYDFFGEHPPQLIGVEVGYGKVSQVPWGSFLVPSVPGGKFECGYKIVENKYLFKFTCTCARKYEKEVESLRDAVTAYLAKNSIYKGKAISIRFTDDAGNRLIDLKQVPTPKFLDLSKAREEELVFPTDVDAAIRTNLFTPIDRMQEAKAIGVPIKRGILLAGDFGVGKTLTAYVAAYKAGQNGMTYV